MDFNDLPPDKKAALLDEVKRDPTALGYTDTSVMDLPSAVIVESVAVKGSVFAERLAAFESAKVAAANDRQSAVKQAVKDSALGDVRTAESDLEAANDAFNTAHRVIDAAAAEIALALNAPNLATTLPVGPVALETIVGAITDVDLAAISLSDERVLDFYLRGSLVDTASESLRSFLFRIFPDGTVTRANLLTVMERPASRAEILFGAGAVVQPWDVARVIKTDKAKI